MLAIITIVYRNYEVLHDFIVSLSAQSSHLYTLYIVDLTSCEERQVIPWIRKIEDKITYLTGDNKGYAHGVNIGIKEALRHGFTHFAVVNPDIIFDKDFVMQASQALAHHPRSIIGGKIYYAPGYEYHQKTIPLETIPYPQQKHTYTIWYAGGIVDWKHAITKHVGVDSHDDEKWSESGPTETVTGCLMLYDKTVHDMVGLWDEEYFMYYEDSDYCVRAQKKRIKIFYNPSIIIWHKNAQSTSGSGSSFHMSTMEKSRLRFGLKYAPLKTKLHLIKNYIWKLKVH